MEKSQMNFPKIIFGCDLSTHLVFPHISLGIYYTMNMQQI